VSTGDKNMKRSTGMFRVFLHIGFVCLLILGASAMATAQSSGAFTETGNMTTARVSHTAILLANGNVLIVGGGAGAELYDPSTGTFARTGDMVTPRIFGISATLLPDGKVLIAGGAVASTSAGVTNTASVELYDPSTGMFPAAGEMVTAKGCPAATLLANGKVLIAGGAEWNEPSSAASAELYDPATGAFTSAGPYANSNPRVNADLGFCPKANLLPDGKVLIIWDDMDSSAELYDPGADRFSPAGSMIRPPGLTSPATLLTNGKILFAGGEDGETSIGFDSGELYDPATGTSIATGKMTTPRFDHTSTLLPDGTVLIAGSQRSGADGGSALASAEVYDPATGIFSATGSMITARFAHSATLLADGTVLIAGGTANANGGSPGARAEIYHPAADAPTGLPGRAGSPR
jgi:hypothetical protein